MDASYIVGGLMLVFQALIGIIGWIAKSSLSSIKQNSEATIEHLQTLNGRVTRVEVQVTEHSKLDEMRFDALGKQIDRLDRD
jgi:hypothetical protein